MPIITLCYRKIIDATATKPWDKLVFDSSYMEFRMQAQNYTTGTNFTTWGQLLHHVPNAHKLPGMVAPAVSPYVQQLNAIVPDILSNAGKRFLKFDRFEFEIINSDIDEKSKHQVAINFFSVPMMWHDTIGEHLLVSEYQPDAAPGNEAATNLFKLQPYLNICTIKLV